MEQGLLRLKRAAWSPRQPGKDKDRDSAKKRNNLSVFSTYCRHPKMLWCFVSISIFLLLLFSDKWSITRLLFCFNPGYELSLLQHCGSLCWHIRIHPFGTWRHLLSLLIAHVLLFPQHHLACAHSGPISIPKMRWNVYSGRFHSATGSSLKNSIASVCFQMHQNEPLSATALTDTGFRPPAGDVAAPDRCFWFQRCLRQMLPRTFKEDELQTFGLDHFQDFIRF